MKIEQFAKSKYYFIDRQILNLTKIMELEKKQYLRDQAEKLHNHG